MTFNSERRNRPMLSRNFSALQSSFSSMYVVLNKKKHLLFKCHIYVVFMATVNIILYIHVGAV